MKKSIFYISAAGVVFGLSGCTTIVGSASSQTEKSGVAYMLPKSLLPVELTESSGAFVFSVKAPELLGDSSRQFVLTRSGNSFSSDNVQVTIDAASGLLDAVKVDSTDETLVVVSKIAGIFAQESGGVGSAQNLVFRGLLDPSEDPRHINQQINDAVHNYLRTRQRLACAEEAEVEECKSINKLGLLISSGSFRIEVARPSVMGVTRKASSAVEAIAVSSSGTLEDGVVTLADEEKLCRTGICYRINQNFTVTLFGPDGTSNSVSAALPNASPTYVLPVDRWPFVKNSHDIKLQSGVLKSVTTDRPSSALALASAPLNVVKAGFQTIGEVVQLKIDLSGKEKALADAEIARIKAQSDLDKLRAKDGVVSAESGLVANAEKNNDLVSLRVGISSAKPVNAIEGIAPESSSSEANDGRTRGSSDGAEPAR